MEYPGLQALESLAQHVRQPVNVEYSVEGTTVFHRGILESVSPVRMKVGTQRIPTLGFKSFVTQITCPETGEVLYKCTPPEGYQFGDQAAVLEARRNFFGPDHSVFFIAHVGEGV
ncbi:MAG: hypothetical protein HYV78_00225 [Candidatus Wildermuthbacteria bacterium]|nr:hypothetical protein [Candidatus Wildermuthbacteria bacterium]